MVRSSTRHFKNSVRKNKYKRNNIKKYSNRKRGGAFFRDLIRKRNKQGSNTQRGKPVARGRVVARATASGTGAKYNLERFIIAQGNGDGVNTETYDHAIQEMSPKADGSTGKKKTHWIWYCFPKFLGNGSSDLARKYAIETPQEAVDYFRDRILKDRYINLSVAVKTALDDNRTTIYKKDKLLDVMGKQIDVDKLHGSVSLFYLVAKHLRDETSASTLEGILNYYGGVENIDKTTLVMFSSVYDNPLDRPQSTADVNPFTVDRYNSDVGIQNVGLGLQNGGNQCYMNAVIQAFTSIPSIQAKILALDNLEVRPMLYNLKEIINRKNEKIVLRNSEDATNRLNPDQLSPIESIKKIIINIIYNAPEGVVERYSDKLTEKLRSDSIDKLKIIALSYRDINKALVRVSTKDALIRLIIEEANAAYYKSNFNFLEDVDKFKGRTQEDSSEFLTFLLNYIEFREYFILDRIIQDNKFMCGGCPQYSKNNYERHNKLEIPINGNSVQASINQYFRQEGIDEGKCDDDYINGIGEVFGSSGCIGDEGLIKSIGLGIFPEVLIISLVRFGGGYVHVGGEVVYLGEKITDEIEITPVININGQEYNLQAVVYHSGATTNVGHYTADCLVDGSWINYNDETTSDTVPPHDSELRQSYILFYTLGRQAGAQVGVQSTRLLPQIELPDHSEWERDIARYQSVLALL